MRCLLSCLLSAQTASVVVADEAVFVDRLLRDWIFLLWLNCSHQFTTALIVVLVSRALLGRFVLRSFIPFYRSPHLVDALWYRSLSQWQDSRQSRILTISTYSTSLRAQTARSTHNDLITLLDASKTPSSWGNFANCRWAMKSLVRESTNDRNERNEMQQPGNYVHGIIFTCTCQSLDPYTGDTVYPSVGVYTRCTKYESRWAMASYTKADKR